jgi:hypothetical protein
MSRTRIHRRSGVRAAGGGRPRCHRRDAGQISQLVIDIARSRLDINPARRCLGVIARAHPDAAAAAAGAAPRD